MKKYYIRKNSIIDKSLQVIGVLLMFASVAICASECDNEIVFITSKIISLIVLIVVGAIVNNYDKIVK